MRIGYGISGEYCGNVSGNVMVDPGTALEDVADFLVRWTLKRCGAESFRGWSVALWVDGKCKFLTQY